MRFGILTGVVTASAVVAQVGQMIQRAVVKMAVLRHGRKHAAKTFTVAAGITDLHNAARFFAGRGCGLGIAGLIIFGGGLLLKQEPELIAIASTANVGGSTIVLPMAQSFRRMDLLLPGILVGSLGSALGTYLGFAMVQLVGG